MTSWPPRGTCDRADALGEPNGLPQHPYRRRVARARLLEAEGDPGGALALLEEAERVYVGDFSPDVRPVAAHRARTLLTLGRLPEALAWARERHLAPDDPLHYLREFEHVTLARILLQQVADTGSGPVLREAADLLERLRAAAEDGGRTATVIEVLALQAVAHHARHGRHDLPGALAPLEAAVRLAEPEGHVHVVLDAGPSVLPLLEALARRNPGWAHPQRLLAGLVPPAGLPDATGPPSPTPSAGASSTSSACSPPTSPDPPSPASSSCRSTPSGPTPRASTPSSA